MKRAPDERSRPPHILIVDDEDFVRSSFQLYFETLGYRVWTAEGGESALRIFRERSKDLDAVLLDLVMPGIHGIEVLRQMKEFDPSVEVVIATGCGNMNTAIQALRFGAYDYVTKPIVDFEEDLLRVVQDAVRLRRSRLGPSSAPRAGSAGSRGSDVSADELIAALEDLVRKSRPNLSFREKVAALGGFLADCFSAVAAIAFEQFEGDRVACLAQWGDFSGDPEAAADPRLPLLRALAIAASLSDEPSWQALDPEVSDFASTVREAEAPPEALILPVDFGEFREKRRNVRLLVLRPGRGDPRTPIPAPRLLSLVVSNLLAGAEGVAVEVASAKEPG